MADYDCIIIGAGFGGLRALIEARRRGLSVRLIEAGGDVGGNRYPGARTDSPSWSYCLAFDDDMLQDWNWSQRYPTQPEVQRYLSYVTDRFDLRKDIEFGTRVETAVRDETSNAWTVTTGTGRALTCTYLIPAVGPLSSVYEPPFPGMESFKGERYLTAQWPEEGVDFTGKRVGIVGTGATGVQLIPMTAQTAKHLTVFQRTPNFVVPARNAPLEEQERQGIKATYPAIWAQVHSQFFGMPVEPAGRVMSDVDEAERERIFDRAWEAGGWNFLFSTFDDLLLDQHSNDIAAEYIRSKIRAVVNNPETAALLCPTNHPFGTKRPPLGHYYYETYNHDNVSLVDVSGNPVDAVTERGVRLTDGSEHELDVLIFATGFDAASGSFTAIDIRGTDGRSLGEVWEDGAQAHLGIGVTGFPNMFIIGGPGLPFANFPPVLEKMSDWIGDAIMYLREHEIDAIEADQDAMDAWTQKLQAIIDATLLGQGEAVRTWFLGANIPGKAHFPLFYLGGLPAYSVDLDDCTAHGYSGFTLSGARPAVAHA
jgi:cation diffusion facilitator CzcD-associated flavoprotein CzcO